MSNDKITAAAREPYDAMGPIDAPNPPAARATLADVKPGGRVRLGDQAERARFEAWARKHGLSSRTLREAYEEAQQAALSAQPSTGGQDALREAAEFARRVLAEIYATYQVKIGPFASQAQLANVKLGSALAARQPVGEPVDDYDSALQEADRPPYLVDAAGIYALESFLTVADEFRRSAEPYIEAINEGACGGGDEVSQAFDTQLARAKEAVSRSVVYTAPPAQAVDLGQFRPAVELMEWQDRGHANPDFPRGDAKKHAEALRLLALIDSHSGVSRD